MKKTNHDYTKKINENDELNLNYLDLNRINAQNENNKNKKDAKGAKKGGKNEVVEEEKEEVYEHNDEMKKALSNEKAKYDFNNKIKMHQKNINFEKIWKLCE